MPALNNPFRFFDKIWYINLDYRVDRKNEILTQLNKVQIDKITERFAAIPGGCVGCNISHYTLTKMSQLKNLENYLVIEDDLIWIRDDVNDILTEALAQLPDDWDMLYLAPNLGSAPKKISKNLIQIQDSPSTTAFAVRSTLFSYILEHGSYLLTSSTQYFDRFLAHEIQHKFKCYAINPLLATQSASYSDIANAIPNITDGHGAWDIVNNFNRNIKLMEN